MLIHNPIIPGFNPDPSIVRVGDDYYIATSSFSFFPGIPIYHSRDLVHWEQISYAFTNPDWLPLEPTRVSSGLYAPTLRYHEGLFYVIVCNNSVSKTYVVTAEDPKGPWSEPHVLPATFDPDLFWDEDGTCYLSENLTHSFPGRDKADIGDMKIGMAVLDTEKWELGEIIPVWTGALFNAISPEAPHIYKKDGYYYLLISEGGTEYYHAVTIARSRNILGPYEGYDGNPILTMRHLRHNYPIVGTGHADMVETPSGEWYIVFLGYRIYGGYHKNMGRETFIAPMIWEEGWPVVFPDTGKCEWTYKAPKGVEPCPFVPELKRDEFNAPDLALCWNSLGTPNNNIYRLADSRLYLRAAKTPVRPFENERNFPKSNASMTEVDFYPHAMSFLGRRQSYISFSAAVKMEFSPKENETAGLVYIQNNRADLRIELAQENGNTVLRVMKFWVDQHNENYKLRAGFPIDSGEECLKKVAWTGNTAFMRIATDGQRAFVMAGKSENEYEILLDNVDVSYVATETCGGFVGAYLGMFCSGNGVESDNEAAFDWFEYSGDNVYSREDEQ